jgi:hypothetical protein
MNKKRTLREVTTRAINAGVDAFTKNAMKDGVDPSRITLFISLHLVSAHSRLQARRDLWELRAHPRKYFPAVGGTKRLLGNF